MTRITFSVLVFAALFTCNAAAQKPAAKPQPCANATNQQEMNRCAAEAFQKADAELNKVYQQLLPKLEAAHREKLKAAQRAWLAFRDAHCECEAFSFDGGTMQPLIRSGCLEAVTRDRTKQLRATLQENSK